MPFPRDGMVGAPSLSRKGVANEGLPSADPQAPSHHASSAVASTLSDSEKYAPASSSHCYDAAIIVPMYNVAEYVSDALESVLGQTGVPLVSLEIVLFDDSSSDATFAAAEALMPRLCASLGRAVLLRGSGGPRGCGASRNAAADASDARVLVFLDADDIMLPDRIARTLAAFPMGDARAISGRGIGKGDGHDNVDNGCRRDGDGGVNDHGSGDDSGGVVGVIGGNFERFPPGSTPRYQGYHDSLTGNTTVEGGLFPFAFRDAPLAMPTVACLRRVWEAVGKFAEGPGVSEDLYFQYAAMECGYVLRKLEGAPLVRYRFHDRMTSLMLTRLHMLSIRTAAFEKLVVRAREWKTFSIWGAGRDGKDFYKMLSAESKSRVRAWGEVSPRKIGKEIYGIPVVHWSQLVPPIATCVALDRRGREFEDNLASRNFTPGVDFVYMN